MKELLATVCLVFGLVHNETIEIVGDDEGLDLEEATFEKDFGVFCAGETVDNLHINWLDGELVEYQNDGTVVKKQKWVATPLE